MTEKNTKIDPREQLAHLFSYKAEWLHEQLFELYTEPSYFPELKSKRPCILIGGRGTGKTTALKGLSYDGQFALAKKEPAQIPSFPFYGVYYRVNTNRTTMFRGEELSELEWKKLFSHYFNIIICRLFVEFLCWYESHCMIRFDLNASTVGLKSFAKSLHIDENKVTSSSAVFELLDEKLFEFEAALNNILDEKPKLSVLGAPIDAFVHMASKLEQFKSKQFFVIIDEYENLEKYQQEIVNTLIKHCENYPFKVGMRELGWKSRATNSPDEELRSPADFDSIDIIKKFDDNSFKKFAFEVCNTRLAKVEAQNPGRPYIRNIEELIPHLPENVEAERLGVKEIAAQVKADLLKNELSDAEILFVNNLEPLQLYFLHYWQKGREVRKKPAVSFLDLLRNMMSNPSKWGERYENYKYALLFTLVQGKRGIKKYYCGAETFTYLAAGNIRFLLELVDQSLKIHLSKEKNDLSKPISFEDQTKAAQKVGRSNLVQLEGLAAEGGKLTKLLLGLGRVFGVMISKSEGHTPELTQFSLDKVNHSHNPDITEEVDLLLKSGVRHLALYRTVGNKLTSSNDIRDYDYMIHPIFSAFFAISYRKKRKMLMSEDNIFGLVNNNHKSTIKALLKDYESAYPVTDDLFKEESFSGQLSLFSSYYLDLE